MKRWLQQLHHNQQGAISVLVLLTIWCLVALIAMLWNTAEYSVRRQQLQNGVDAMVYAPTMWMSRTLNQETAQNMLIAQDASADIIFRASKVTDRAIDNELATELKLLDALEARQRQLMSRLPGLIQNINVQYSFLHDALTLVQDDVANGSIKFPDPQAATVYKNKLRQAIYAANWVQTVYVPQLKALADQAINVIITDKMLEQARQTIGTRDNPTFDTEYGTLVEFENQINGAPTDTTELMQQHELKLFQDQQNLAASFPATASAQAEAIAQFYKLPLSGGSGPVINVPAPVMPASEPASIPHVDSIRESYPEWAAKYGLPIHVTIDPINPNTNDPNGTNNKILHPPIPFGLNAIYMDVAGGWGHCWLFPIERYLSNRVGSDMVLLRDTYMVPIDAMRMALAKLWASELALVLNVPALPGSIPDPQPDPITQSPTTIPILPDLNATDASGRKTSADFVYARASGAYLVAVRRLESVLRDYQGMFNRFTTPYAVPTWNARVDFEHAVVAAEVGTSKNFMILRSYVLKPVPAWAEAGMRASLTEAVSWQIYRQNSVLWPLGVNAAFGVIQGGVTEIVNEMLSRPWPYEKSPPVAQVPPAPGMGKMDRQKYFSLFAIVLTPDANAPKLLFPQLFGGNTQLAAYAQAETFNWMEYNDNYGGYFTEKFDEVSLNTFDNPLACPRAWRLSTIGGWNWQPRMTFVDSLAQAGNDPAIKADLAKVGITNLDPKSLSQINLH